MIQELPIIIIDNSLILKSFGSIFVDMTPFSSVRNFIVCDRVVQLQLHRLFCLDFLYLLATLILINNPLRHPGNEPVLALRLVLDQLLKLLIKFVLSLNVVYFRQILNFFLE